MAVYRAAAMTINTKNARHVREKNRGHEEEAEANPGADSDGEVEDSREEVFPEEEETAEEENHLEPLMALFS